LEKAIFIYIFLIESSQTISKTFSFTEQIFVGNIFEVGVVRNSYTRRPEGTARTPVHAILLVAMRIGVVRGSTPINVAAQVH